MYMFSKIMLEMYNAARPWHGALENSGDFPRGSRHVDAPPLGLSTSEKCPRFIGGSTSYPGVNGGPWWRAKNTKSVLQRKKRAYGFFMLTCVVI